MLVDSSLSLTNVPLHLTVHCAQPAHNPFERAGTRDSGRHVQRPALHDGNLTHHSSLGLHRRGRPLLHRQGEIIQEPHDRMFGRVDRIVHMLQRASHRHTSSLISHQASLTEQLLSVQLLHRRGHRSHVRVEDGRQVSRERLTAQSLHLLQIDQALTSQCFQRFRHGTVQSLMIPMLHPERPERRVQLRPVQVHHIVQATRACLSSSRSNTAALVNRLTEPFHRTATTRSSSNILSYDLPTQPFLSVLRHVQVDSPPVLGKLLQHFRVPGVSDQRHEILNVPNRHASLNRSSMDCLQHTSNTVSLLHHSVRNLRRKLTQRLNIPVQHTDSDAFRHSLLDPRLLGGIVHTLNSALQLAERTLQPNPSIRPTSMAQHGLLAEVRADRLPRLLAVLVGGLEHPPPRRQFPTQVPQPLLRLGWQFRHGTDNHLTARGVSPHTQCHHGQPLAEHRSGQGDPTQPLDVALSDSLLHVLPEILVQRLPLTGRTQLCDLRHFMFERCPPHGTVTQLTQLLDQPFGLRQRHVAQQFSGTPLLRQHDLPRLASQNPLRRPKVHRTLTGQRLSQLSRTLHTLVRYPLLNLTGRTTSHTSQVSGLTASSQMLNRMQPAALTALRRRPHSRSRQPLNRSPPSSTQRAERNPRRRVQHNIVHEPVSATSHLQQVRTLLVVHVENTSISFRQYLPLNPEVRQGLHLPHELLRVTGSHRLVTGEQNVPVVSERDLLPTTLLVDLADVSQGSTDQFTRRVHKVEDFQERGDTRPFRFVPPAVLCYLLKDNPIRLGQVRERFDDLTGLLLRIQPGLFRTSGTDLLAREILTQHLIRVAREQGRVHLRLRRSQFLLPLLVRLPLRSLVAAVAPLLPEVQVRRRLPFRLQQVRRVPKRERIILSH